MCRRQREEGKGHSIYGEYSTCEGKGYSVYQNLRCAIFSTVFAPISFVWVGGQKELDRLALADDRQCIDVGLAAMWRDGRAICLAGATNRAH